MEKLLSTDNTTTSEEKDCDLKQDQSTIIDDNIIILRCNHNYHQSCISNWLQVSIYIY